MRNDSFSSLGLSPALLPSLGERGIACPTPIQARVIPRLLEGKSLIFRSATGTGKTFAYLLPLLERLLSPPPESAAEAPAQKEGRGGWPLLLVAAPTFELCSQIKSEADFLLKNAPRPVRTALLVGQASMERQIETLKREHPEVIVGNPGRILALAREKKLRLRGVRFLVLDEGDRLTGDDLYAETREMVSLLASFQGASCSATLPEKSRERLLPLLGIPAAGEAAGASIVEDDDSAGILKEKVEHWAFFCPGREKPDLLRSLIAALEQAAREKGKKPAPVKALIFIGRAGEAENIASRLKRYKLPADFLSGRAAGKNRRKQTLDAFRSGKTRFLVSSDLASRGLDIDGISHVIALDVSEDKNVYIHRAGRTARAGKSGVMISVGTEGEMRRLSALEKTLGITVYPKVLYGGKILAPSAD